MGFADRVRLGRTGLEVGPLAVASSYGVPAHAIEKAFHERGVNLFYWGSIRRGGMREAIRNLARGGRERIAVALQSYDRTGVLMPLTFERGLRSLGIGWADLLILGWHNRTPSPRVLDAALELKERGRVRFIAMSGHHRPLFAELARQGAGSPIDVLMVRYNAAHRGAEAEVFPHLPGEGRPGILCYTATRWGHLLKPARMPEGETPLSAADCYRFVLTHPAVDVCMSGPASAIELDQALEALDGGPMGEEELARARRIGDHVHAGSGLLGRTWG